MCVKPEGVKSTLCKGAFHEKAQPLSHRVAGSAAASVIEDIEPGMRILDI